MIALVVYLDTSVYNRPFDDQKQPRIWLETLAFSIILQMIEQGEALLVSSSVVEYETSRNPHAERRAWVRKIGRLAQWKLKVDRDTRNRAQMLEEGGIKAMDALHIACAEQAKVDFFITCDDRLIRAYHRRSDRKLFITNPTGFARNHNQETGGISL